ncbi:helix-turn-helix domain-containing protein [Nocardia sp. NPDC127526]|uniref:MmyB family transcriptional regulator n=1 Tax=Nocardia sp. NPDC127526 TaxID=3345393 RepID=UPI003641A9B5
MTDPFDLAEFLPEQPMLGMYMRHRRESLGMTQEEVARGMFVSVSLYRKLESGERPISVDRLEDWCAVVSAPVWMLQKMVSLAVPKMFPRAVGAWPPQLRQEDLDHIESFPFPAYFHRFPEYEILAANSVAREMIPWLQPTEPDADRPANVIERMMTEPLAREVLGNWEEIVHRLLFILRVNSPGVVAPERLAQIIETCRTNPDFERLWRTDMDEAVYNNSLATVRNPETGELHRFTMRSYNSFHPDNCNYQLFTLTPRPE